MSALRPDLRVRLDGAVATLRSAIAQSAGVETVRADLVRVLEDVCAHVTSTHAPVTRGPCAGHTATRRRYAETLGCSEHHVTRVVALASWRAPWPDARRQTTDRRPGETRTAAWARRNREARGIQPRASKTP